MFAALRTAYRMWQMPRGLSWFERGYLAQFQPLAEPPEPREAGLQVTRNIPYHAPPDGDGGACLVDVYRPAPPQPSRLPALLFVHGGGWRAAGKNDPLGVHSGFCVRLAAQGLVVAAMNHHLAPEHGAEEQAADVARALLWLRSNAGYYGGDVERLYLCGHVSGAQLAAWVALHEPTARAQAVDPAWVRGVIGLAGVYDVPDFARSPFARRRMVEPAFGSDPAALAQASPVTLVHEGAPPFLLLHPAHDAGLATDPEAFAERLQEAGARADVRRYEAVDPFALLTEQAPQAPVVEDILTFVAGHGANRP